jgi:hypothetical protein
MTVSISIMIIEAIIIVILSYVCFVSIKININRAEKIRELENKERLDREGIRIRTKVTNVIIRKELKKYVVVTEGYGPEKKTLYTFRQSFRFPKGATARYYPIVKKGDTVFVLTAFNPLISRMEKNW